jgi:hypothetical protein
MAHKVKGETMNYTADIKAEGAEVEFWSCPDCGGTCDLEYEHGTVPVKRCQDCEFCEELS